MKSEPFPVWVLRPLKRDGSTRDLYGHIFDDEGEARRWISQEYVRDHYRISPGMAVKRRCPCGGSYLKVVEGGA